MDYTTCPHCAAESVECQICLDNVDEWTVSQPYLCGGEGCGRQACIELSTTTIYYDCEHCGATVKLTLYHRQPCGDNGLIFLFEAQTLWSPSEDEEQ